MGTRAVRQTPSGVGNGVEVGVDVGVQVGDDVNVGLGVTLGRGVRVADGAGVEVRDAVEVRVADGVDAGVGLASRLAGLALGPGVSNRTTAVSAEGVRCDGADSEDAEGISPGCEMARRRSRAAKNQ
jgi:hypothetical protein